METFNEQQKGEGQEGEKMDSIRNPEIEKIAEGLYSKELPYHNFEHALKAVAVGLKIADKCIEEGMEVNKEVVYYALLFHDAGYHLDYLGAGFSNKEEHSAYLAEISLKKVGIESSIIELVKEAILATVQDAEFYSTEETIVRVADLAEIASDYGTFLDNNKKLKKEEELITAVPITWEKWKQGTKKVIEFYLSQNIRLTSAYEDENGESIFHKQARKNLEQFISEDVTILEKN